MLGWPLWWVSVCSVLCLLIVQAVVINVVLFRRDSVTVGTDDDAPALRLAVAAVTTVPWRRPPLSDMSAGRCPTGPSPGMQPRWWASRRTSPRPPEPSRRVTPVSAIDRAASMMAPESADAFKAQFANYGGRFGEAEGQRPGADHLGRPGGPGVVGGQCDGHHAWDAGRTRTQARQCRAGIAGGAVQAGRRLEGRRRVTDQLPLTGQPPGQQRVIDLEATVHHDRHPLPPRRFANPDMPQALLQPQAFRVRCQLQRLPQNLGEIVVAAKDVDHIGNHRQVGKAADRP